MKELQKKTNLTIFAILSAILITALTILNINNYRREYGNIERSLNIFDDRGGFRMGGKEPGAPDALDATVAPDTPDAMDVAGVPDAPDAVDVSGAPGAPDAPAPPDATGVLGAPSAPGVPEKRMRPRDPENMMVMDNEVYTVKLDENLGISEIYSHGNESEDFLIGEIAEEIEDIVEDEEKNVVFIGNLYEEDYSYKYRYRDSIVILNNADIKEKLKLLLFESIIILLVMEAVLFMASRLITGWIVRPAKEAFKRQKEFIADASHELKTPLAVIMASADELGSLVKGDEGSARYIENIRYESDRMNRLIAGLLDLSRLEDGNTKSSYKEEDVSRIVEKTCLAYDGVAFEQGVAINTDIEEGLRLKCSKDEIEKMVSTILDNAVKHSYRDTIVRVSAARAKGSLAIKIVNTGDPIKDEDRERIFERFYRADKARGRSDNRYGLGLAIAKRIAENHNGDIRAYSEGGNTTFEISLRT